MNKCVIVGGGISGLMNAYYLNKANKDVVVIDKDLDDIEKKTSFGNAGLLSAFSKTPLSHPGVFLETLSLLVQNKSPLYMSNIPNIKTITWALKFFTNATAQNTKHTMNMFEKYGQESLEQYDYLNEILKLDFYYKKEGFLSVFTNEKKYNEQLKNINKEKISVVEIKKAIDMCPLIDSEKIKGALLLHKNAHIDPCELINKLYLYLVKQGVKFIKDEIDDVQIKNNKIISLKSKKDKFYKGDNFILASGIDTKIANKLGVNLMQIPTKGYSITLDIDNRLKPTIPMMLVDKFIILSPRASDIRITSNLEIGSSNTKIDTKKVQHLLKRVKEATVDFDTTNIKPWCGFRALTPNDRPLIGRDVKYTNFIYSMGFGWLGMTLAPALANMTSSLIINNLENSQVEGVSEFSGL